MYVHIIIYTYVATFRGVGAKLEVVRQNFRAVSKFHDQNWRIHIQLRSSC